MILFGKAKGYKEISNTVVIIKNFKSLYSNYTVHVYSISSILLLEKVFQNTKSIVYIQKLKLKSFINFSQKKERKRKKLE